MRAKQACGIAWGVMIALLHQDYPGTPPGRGRCECKRGERTGRAHSGGIQWPCRGCPGPPPGWSGSEYERQER